ncbi:MAG: zinc-dependent alcohol dehydrogenase family protein [Gammaproteobacteria bacterium]|nr:zinc-dependent alcohol dehydrogenase family protein [Gammaproteobacteria bacterium]
MRAMVLENSGSPLKLVEREPPPLQAGEVLVRVNACGVCRTDLHVCDGDLEHPALPLVPGHEIVGTVTKCGPGVTGLEVGQRIGVPWLGGTCGNCRDCRNGRENLCEQAVFTGYTRDGGYADYTTADHRFCFPIPERYSDVAAAPLLCAGLIGYRSYRMVDDARRIGLYGFGAAAHILVQIARHQGREVYAFTRPGDGDAQAFARELGALWAGDSDEDPPVRLDAAIIFAPVGPLVPVALRGVGKGGVVVCAGIHMSDIPGFPYAWLWGERVIRSVANLTRQDGLEFMRTIAEVPVHTRVVTFPLLAANDALEQMRSGRLQGAAVLDLN